MIKKIQFYLLGKEPEEGFRRSHTFGASAALDEVDRATLPEVWKNKYLHYENGEVILKDENGVITPMKIDVIEVSHVHRSCFKYQDCIVVTCEIEQDEKEYEKIKCELNAKQRKMEDESSTNKPLLPWKYRNDY